MSAGRWWGRGGSSSGRSNQGRRLWLGGDSSWDFVGDLGRGRAATCCRRSLRAEKDLVVPATVTIRLFIE